MIVLSNNIKNINKKQTYVKKKCKVCDSVIAITNGDALNETCDRNGDITMPCPCCNTHFQLKKYFFGKAYGIDQYSEVVAKFSQELNDIIYELYKINQGYGKEYFSISNIGLVGTETAVCIVVYINKYEHGNWAKIVREDVCYKKYVLDIAKKILCDTFYDYTKYAQALLDYVKQELSRPAMNNAFTCDYFIEQSESIIACLRGGDFGSMVEIGDKHNKLLEQKKIADHTIYTPDIKDGLTYIGDKIEEGSESITRGLFSIACSIREASIRQQNAIQELA